MSNDTTPKTIANPAAQKATRVAPSTEAKEKKPTRVERAKEGSAHLRGTIAEVLHDTETTGFKFEDEQLLKFHGIYQQKNRDNRKDRTHKFMLRTCTPGGRITGAQYLVFDDLAEKYAGGTLRLVLDRAVSDGAGAGENGGGVTLQDCEAVSREASALLDVEDFASGHYVLEVSSPGLDREFYRESDYERFAGQRVRVTWRDPTTGAKRTDLGTLTAADLGQGDIALENDGHLMTIRLSDVITTRLEPDF